jgi:pyruvate dehydrogenase E2 component (dihydrolipoamide acetyltransferase)
MSSRRIPFAGVRKAITQRLSPGFHQALPVALMTEFRADKLLEYKKQRGKISITACSVKAAALALKKHPEINVTFEGEELVYHDEVNIAVGVDTPRGLRAPVIKDADKKTLEELTRIIDEFAEKGRRGEITLADQEGHSFTVTNLGMTGVTYFTPIINPPDCAILGVGAIILKPIISDDGLMVGKVGHLTLVFDHRVIDGMPASRFLNEVKMLLEDPDKLE